MTETKVGKAKLTLKELRQAAGLNQRDVAEAVGVSAATVSRFENGIGVESEETRLLFEQFYGSPEIDWIDRNNAGLGWVRYTDPNAPKRSLGWWRRQRRLSVEELASLAGISPRAINSLERGATLNIRPKNRRALAKALMVAPEKIELAADDPDDFHDKTAMLRADLRAARRQLWKAYDFLREDANIAFSAQSTRDDLLPDIAREMRG